MKKTIDQISYKDNELDLYYRVQTRCKYVSKSGWYKEAIYEKLEREENLSDNYNIDRKWQHNENENLTNPVLMPIKHDGLANLLESLGA